MQTGQQQRECLFCGAPHPLQARFCPGCGKPISHVVDDADSGTHLPTDHILYKRYRIVRHIADGGFGIIYQASDMHGDRLVAIKEMSQDGLQPRAIPTAVSRFIQEARLLAKLAHPNLPHIYDQFSEEGRWYLVMEFIYGQTLETLLAQAKDHKLSPQDAFSIALQLGSVLEYLHTSEPPVIFRDLKPGNVMLTDKGHVYLIDFGIARHFKPGQAKDTNAFGSPGYAAPEQYGITQTTPRSDIYSLGALLHQMLTGDDPALAPFRFAPIELRHPLSHKVALLVSRMVDVDMNKRPSTMMQVKEELEQYARQWQTMLEEEVPATRQLPAVAAQQTSIMRAHATPIRALAWSPDGVFLASAGEDNTLHFWSTWPVTPQSTYHISSSHSYQSYIHAIQWSPNGLFLTLAFHDGTVKVWPTPSISPAWQNPSPVPHTGYYYRNHTAPVRSVAWSPNGEYIASASQDTTARVWRSTNGEDIMVFRGHSSWIYALNWSPDGRYIASAGRDQRVRVWEALTGRLLVTYRKHCTVVRSVVWSPDGRFIASAGNDNSIHVWDWRTGENIFTCLGHTQYINTLSWILHHHPYKQAPLTSCLLSAGNDKNIMIWDGTTGRHLYTYKGHTGWILAAAISPYWQLVASGDSNGTLHLWPLQTH